MYKYILGVDGMKCGGCEAHVQDVIRRNISISKVKASHVKKEVLIYVDHELKEEELQHIFAPTGYSITSIKKEDAVKKLFGWR